MSPIELWGGVECTVNRVGERVMDQCHRSGHHDRLDDLDRFAALGVKALRYPVLWERTAPDDRGALEGADWRWSDARLARIRALGMRPIAGLVHHGAGPRATSLVDPRFADGLARYARAVAERYPWVTEYTPVNEPLTTARFSGLYGHWHPHGRDDKTFVRALLTQCRAVVLAMRAIREVNPAARLVQTEDMGETFSTEPLRYQAEHENHRRWLSLDLLAGRVDRHHPLWAFLLRAEVGEAELAFFAENPCVPDVVGMNYYVTSDRFLDHRVERYPAHALGGNALHPYADVEAVRAGEAALLGHREVLLRAHARYGRPVAITEAHLGGHREEQLRWLSEAWRGAKSAQAAGADVRAVTTWALLGAHDWDSLVTREQGRYESGAFDLRGEGAPHPTVLCAALKDLAGRGDHDHPLLDVPGWWRRPERVRFPSEAPATPTQAAARWRARPLAIVGASSALGRALMRLCTARGIAFCTAESSLAREGLAQGSPWAVIHADEYRRVDRAEREPERCRHRNVLCLEALAAQCRRMGVPLLAFSSDQVFDGARRAPYVERDAVSPLSVYGRSKAEGERRVFEALPGALVVRAGARFSPLGARDFVGRALRAWSAGESVRVPDAVISPAYLPDLASASLDLLIDGAQGLWHLSHPGEVTWEAFARKGARAAGLSDARVEVCDLDALGLLAARPAYSALASERAALMPSLDDALARYAADASEWLRAVRSRPRRVDPTPLRRPGEALVTG